MNAKVTWQWFVQTYYGAEVRKFFLKLNVEMEAEATKNLDGRQEVVLVLNTKKGYWLYKLFMREEGETVHHVFVCSDRYVKKMMNYSFFQDKVIYLIDDTLINGFSLMETYGMLVKMGGAADKIHPVVFALNEQVDLKEKEHDSDQAKAEFWKKMKYFIRMPQEDMGAFCMMETKLLHNESIPYMIDLPYLKNEERPDMDYEVVLTEEQFTRLQECDELWEFHFNSYSAPGDNGEKLLDGFIIQMKDEQLLDATQQFISDFVIVGTYSTDADKNVHAVFVPFAIAKSISKEQLERLWEVLVKNLSDMGSDSCPGEGIGNLWESRYRECAYVLSMMVADRFKTHLEKLTGIRLCYDNQILREHFSAEFIDRIEPIGMRIKKSPEETYRRCAGVIGRLSDESQSLEQLISQKVYDEDEAYKMIADEVHRRRTEFLAHTLKDAMLESGEMCQKLEEYFYFRTETEQRYAFTRIVVTFLQTSMCSSRLRVSQDGRSIEKGFRYGENSDLALPFFDLNFYWAVILFVEKVGKSNALKFYDGFVERLKKKFSSLNLCSDDIFIKNRRYFKAVLENNFQLYNKYFYFRSTRSSIEKSYFNQIEEFVQNIS